MTYFRIKDGEHGGKIGRIIDKVDGLLVVLVQTRDQWIYVYTKFDNLILIKRWGLKIANGTNYVEEL